MNNASEEQLGVALIGCGYWGKNLARIIDAHPSCYLNILVDNDTDKLKALSNQYPHAKTLVDFREALADSSIHAIVVCTPVKTHFQIVDAALKQKKHVLCEKILAENPKMVNQLSAIAKANDMLLMVGHTFLYNSIVKYIKTAIDNGDLGDILYLTFKRTGLGPIRNDVDVINDLAAHDLSILYYWLGMPASGVRTARKYLNDYHNDIAFIQYKYPNGVIADIQVSWLSPMKQRIIEVVGTKQMIFFDDVSTTEKLKLIKTGKDYQSHIKDFGSFQLSIKDGDIIIPSIPYPEPLSEEFNEFVQLILHRSFDNSYDEHLTLTTARNVSLMVKKLTATEYSI